MISGAVSVLITQKSATEINQNGVKLWIKTTMKISPVAAVSAALIRKAVANHPVKAG